VEEIVGCLRKMQVTEAHPVSYALRIGDTLVPLQPLLGKTVSLAHTGRIQCVHCDRPTNKSFAQGYCYPCFKRLAECDTCIMSPERCHFHLGTCRDPEWGQQHCMQTHHVYLANSSGAKVGITRDYPVSTRWIDQGAVQAVVIARTSSRRLAGLVEATLRQFISDRTQWQRMLKGNVEPLDLHAVWANLKVDVADQLQALQLQHGDGSVVLLDAEPVTELSYPVTLYPQKIKSFNLDKTAAIAGRLEGIKGQYLMLDNGVINIRRFSGYEVSFSAA